MCSDLAASGFRMRTGPRPARDVRLISLCPSTTETLIAIGADSALVGVTQYCTRPARVTSRLPKAGGTKNPSLEKIRALSPDLVFMNSEENRAADIEEISREFSVDVTCPRSVEEIPGLLRHFGNLTGCQRAAGDFACEVEERVFLARSQSWPPFRFCYAVWKEPLMLAGPRTYISSLLSLVGGENVLPDTATADYPHLEPGELGALHPEVAVLPDEPYRFQEGDKRLFLESVPGVEVFLVSGADFCWHGVRTIEGIDVSLRLARDLLTRRPKRG